MYFVYVFLVDRCCAVFFAEKQYHDYSKLPYVTPLVCSACRTARWDAVMLTFHTYC